MALCTVVAVLQHVSSIFFFFNRSEWRLRLIKRTDYSTLDTGLDVAHVAYNLMYVHVTWSWPVAVARAAHSHAHVRRRAVEGGAGARGARRA